MKSFIKPQAVLVAFYNRKALGVRYLEAALERAGYGVTTIFYKDFNSVHPHPTTDQEVELFSVGSRPITWEFVIVTRVGGYRSVPVQDIIDITKRIYK